VISARIKNRYGHPSLDVIKNILLKKQGIPVWVNEAENFWISSVVGFGDRKEYTLM
jgi:hypothetical protein